MLDRFRTHSDEVAIIDCDTPWSYAAVLDEHARWCDVLHRHKIPSGAVVAIEADFSLASLGTLLACVDAGHIVVPLTESIANKKDEFRSVAEVEWSLLPDAGTEDSIVRWPHVVKNAMLRSLQDLGHAGLVLFSSGSTGESKAALHDVEPLLQKFHELRRPWRTIPFLLFDHIGGVNTLLYSLSNLGCLVTVDRRSPDAVCAAIERHRVEMLPTSPTFLNLLLVSRAYERHDLSSLQMITYGTEPMPETTIQRLLAVFPRVTFKQTYGLSEVGILQTKSRSSDSLWMRVGGEGYQTRVVNGLLEIKATSAMVGYLNAPSPFTDDGWFKTGDMVEVDGDFMRILGRVSEIINVGGEKVYPAEVEGVIQQLAGVVDAVVYGEANRLVGQVVAARVQISTDETLPQFRSRLRRFCRERLEDYKVPQRVELASRDLHGERFKKQRRISAPD